MPAHSGSIILIISRLIVSVSLSFYLCPVLAYGNSNQSKRRVQDSLEEGELTPQTYDMATHCGAPAVSDLPACHIWMYILPPAAISFFPILLSASLDPF